MNTIYNYLQILRDAHNVQFPLHSTVYKFQLKMPFNQIGKMNGINKRNIEP